MSTIPAMEILASTNGAIIVSEQYFIAVWDIGTSMVNVYVNEDGTNLTEVNAFTNYRLSGMSPEEARDCIHAILEDNMYEMITGEAR